jgi:hypothetical protein
MRKIRDKTIAKLYKQALRSSKAKHTTKQSKTRRRASPLAHRDVFGAGARRRRKLGLKGREKAAVVMREFYHGKLYSGSGHKVSPSRPDIAKAIAMSEGRRSEAPKPRRRRKSKVHHLHTRRVVRKTAPSTTKRRPSPRRKTVRRTAPKTTRRTTTRKPTAKQLAARKKFVEMVRERSRLAKAGKKPHRKRTEAERTALAHQSSRSWSTGRMAKRVKKARHDKKGPDRRKR